MNQRYQTRIKLNSYNILLGDPPSEATDDAKENDNSKNNDATAELVRGTSEGGQEAFQQKQEWRHSHRLIFENYPWNTFALEYCDCHTYLISTLTLQML